MRISSKSLQYCGAIICGLCLSSLTFAENQSNQNVALNYTKLLQQNNFSANPLIQLVTWEDQAKKDHVKYPQAAQLATIKADGSPTIRTIGVKEITTEGIIFNTNPSSNKAKQFAHSPTVALLFVWHDPVLNVSRQVRIEGVASVYAPAKTINFKLQSGDRSVPWQSFILRPTHVEFSQLQHIHNDGVVEYVDYNSIKDHWVKETPADYLAKDGC